MRLYLWDWTEKVVFNVNCSTVTSVTLYCAKNSPDQILCSNHCGAFWFNPNHSWIRREEEERRFAPTQLKPTPSPLIVHVLVSIAPLILHDVFKQLHWSHHGFILQRDKRSHQGRMMQLTSNILYSVVQFVWWCHCDGHFQIQHHFSLTDIFQDSRGNMQL